MTDLPLPFRYRTTPTSDRKPSLIGADRNSHTDRECAPGGFQSCNRAAKSVHDLVIRNGIHGADIGPALPLTLRVPDIVEAPTIIPPRQALPLQSRRLVDASGDA
jgi:hypothetical protein